VKKKLPPDFLGVFFVVFCFVFVLFFFSLNGFRFLDLGVRHLSETSQLCLQSRFQVSFYCRP